jgi:hypothetical protein
MEYREYYAASRSVDPVVLRCCYCTCMRWRMHYGVSSVVWRLRDVVLLSSSSMFLLLEHDPQILLAVRLCVQI